MRILLCAVLALAGCADVARVSVSLPLEDRAPRGRTLIVFATLPVRPSREHGDDALKQVASELEKSFLETGRYGVVESPPPAEPPSSSAADEARRIGARTGAPIAVLVRSVRLDVERRKHSVHEYLDGSATGEAAMVDSRTGTVLRMARESASASARSVYASSAQVREILATRLAGRLARKLLYERRGIILELVDPPDGSLRPGIELARRGEWRPAIGAWSAATDSGPHAAAAHFNVAMALEVLGEMDLSRIHLEAALRIDPGSSRYRRALEARAR